MTTGDVVAVVFWAGLIVFLLVVNYREDHRSRWDRERREIDELARADRKAWREMSR